MTEDRSMYIAKRNLEDLLQSGQERTRLTEQLQIIIRETLDEIADSMTVGDEIALKGYRLRVADLESNIGTWRTVVAVDGDGYLYVFNDRVAPGANFYLHGDFQAELQNAYRELWLRTANHLPEIAMAFEVEAAKAAADMRTIFEKLKTWCDSVGDTCG